MTGRPVTRTIARLRRDIATAFRAQGLDSPELDARILVGHALGLDRTQIAAQADCVLDAAQVEAIAALTSRRLAGEPVARIVGRKEFWSLPLALNRDTLVPRPETETVVEAALAALDRDGARPRPLRIVDFGTGSGALLLALLSELPAAWGVGTDISPAALACARHNAHVLGLGSRATFVACDYGAGLSGDFDLLVANPPYVVWADIAGLAPEVARFDPIRALDGGVDGLDGYRSLARDASRLVAPHGIVIVELGAGQGAAVSSLMRSAGFTVCDPPRTDLAGVARALTLRRGP
ncbi:MAG: peptide chain release factor N(5)-glutamine methyltransferase [Xanthobacteraceae bacterium]